MTRTRDQAVADTARDPVDLVGRCRAHGCPNIWTTMSSQLCRWHSAAPTWDWPRITEELSTEIVTGAVERQRPTERPAPLSKADKVSILGKLRALFASKPVDPKAWAYALRKREQAGEQLSENQRVMWRAAIDSPGDFAQVDVDRLARAKAETARRVEQYARERGLDLEHQSRAGDPAEQRAHGGESRAAATNPTPSRAHAPFGDEAVARQGAQR